MQQTITQFHTTIIARFHDDGIYVQVGDATEVLAVELAVDAGYDIAEEPDGALVVTYVDDVGDIARARSRDGGQTWA